MGGAGRPIHTTRRMPFSPTIATIPESVLAKMLLCRIRVPDCSWNQNRRSDPRLTQSKFGIPTRTTCAKHWAVDDRSAGGGRDRTARRGAKVSRGYRHIHHVVDDRSTAAYSKVLDDQSKNMAAGHWERSPSIRRRPDRTIGKREDRGIQSDRRYRMGTCPRVFK